MKPTFASVLSRIGFTEEVTQRFAHIILPFEPMPHQVEGLRQALSKPRFGLFFEPRTGKTLVLQLTAIFYAYYGTTTMQLMPPGLFYQFRRDYDEIKNHGLKIEIFSAGPSVRSQKLMDWKSGKEARPHVILLSKEIFKKHKQMLPEAGYTHLHFDECHKGLQGGLGTRSSKGSETARAVKAFISSDLTRKLVLSTGTPIPTNIENAFTTVSLLNPKAYRNQDAFNTLHCVYGRVFVPGLTGPRQISVVQGYKNLGALSLALYENGIHASQRDVLNLEAPNIQIVEVKLTGTHAALYRKIVKDQVLTMPDGTLLDARKPQKRRQVALQMITSPERYSKHINENAVFSTLTALTDTVDLSENKVVIFADYVASVEAIADHFKKHHPAIVYGPNGPEKNAQEIERFRNTSCPLAIINFEAGGAGFKLGDVCTTVIYAEPTSSPGTFHQSLSRVLLKGQEKPVVAYILKVVGTLSPIAIEAMMNKHFNISKVMQDENSLLEALTGKTSVLEDPRFHIEEVDEKLSEANQMEEDLA